MALTFRDSTGFAKETAVVAVGAAAAGLIAPLVTGLGLVAAAPAAALLGGSVGAALTKRRPASKWLRVALGVAGGTLAALGHVALTTRFGLGFAGALAGGALGGLALGTLLAGDEEKQSALASAVGIAGATGLGVLGVVGADKIAAFAQSEGTTVMIASPVIAGLLGLWVAAGAGLRRIEQKRDPLLVRAEQLASALADPVRTRLGEAVAAYREVMEQADNHDEIGAATSDEVREHARALLEAMLDTAERWSRAASSHGRPSLKEVEEKLADVSMRMSATDDDVTLAHLTRARQALEDQKVALRGLDTGRVRAEAAIDAQVALLDRLRLAISQFQANDRERFVLELEAVADQVARLGDDLDSLSAALGEADSFSDRRLLADIERAGRRALDRLPDEVEEDEVAEEEHVAVH
jgi:hypothetical protein